MKDIRNIFSRKHVCMPLTNIEGRHVEKYRSFKNFLNHNHNALDIIADMELLYYSGKPFSLSVAKHKYNELSDAVRDSVSTLDSISRGKLSSLKDVFGKIDTAILNEFNPVLSFRTTDIVLDLENIIFEMEKMVGAKAVNLAVVKKNLGLPVPHGFAVTAYAFEKFLEETGLSKPVEEELSKIQSLDSVHAMRSMSDNLKGMVRKAAVPPSIADEIMKAYEALENKTRKGVRIAMRSSAVGEDTEASFAGQYSSVLNVTKDTILEAYKTVLASKYSTRALNYMFQYGLQAHDTPMAVMGLAMVDVVSSGVVYSVDPLHSSAKAVKISSVWGLGEYLVGGGLSPDSFLVERDEERIIERTIRTKERKMMQGLAGGTQLIEIPAGERDRPSIDDDIVFRLRNYAFVLEEFFGKPQDIEWALDMDRNLFILQSRPLRLFNQPYASGIIHEDCPGNPVLFKGGKTASAGTAAGKIFTVTHEDDLDKVSENAILVAKTASPSYAKVMGKIAGLITDIGSVTSHLSSVAREFGVPAIVDAKNATSLLPEGEMVTMVAETGTVYLGAVEKLIKNIRPAKRLIFESPVHKRMGAVLDKISPLNLLNPEHPSFSPEGCRTIHDIIRFTHEQAMRAMFGITEEAEEVRSVKLNATIPLNLRLIDVGGGLKAGLTTCHTVEPEHIESTPMTAIWKGLTHPGISWEGGINVDMKKLVTLFSSSTTAEGMEAPGGISYAILSNEYMNLSVKFAYHFATIDALCGEDSNQNYISLHFSGGAGNYYGKSLRVSFLGNVLEKLEFQVSLKGDLLEASLLRYDRPSMEDKLDQLGRLLASSRLLDVSLSGKSDIETLSDAFFREDYCFLSQKQEDQLKQFYTHGGDWNRLKENGHIYCIQDGSKSGFSISSGIAGVMAKLMGQSLQDYLDNIEAYYYFPLAIARNSEITDGRISVKVKPVSGNIDRAGGLAFGIRNVSNYFVMRINALEDNVMLFEYINNRRIQRANIKRKIESDRWHQLTVEAEGSIIKGYLDGALVMEYDAGKSLKGFIGLWTKADSVTHFDELTVQTDNKKRTIEF
ncbi:MAG: pyruvate, phosphate dikinase [Nitrospirae bacterium]|nr:pyruvate, phosphate dikinase [Nitrospirota bacterium]